MRRDMLSSNLLMREYSFSLLLPGAAAELEDKGTKDDINSCLLLRRHYDGDEVDDGEIDD